MDLYCNRSIEAWLKSNTYIWNYAMRAYLVLIVLNVRD